MEGQIGLEKTPEEYVAKMVAVFREVRRVLRGDGTCWVNLGDSYACSPVGQFNGGGDCLKGRDLSGHSEGSKRNKVKDSGLKPKDLCGIPWRVARALQEPYYTGTIKNIEDRIWLAAMIDAEGCMFIHKRKVGQNNGQGYERQSDNFAPGLEVANTSEAIVKRCLDIIGKGSICSQSPDQNNRRKQKIYRYNLRTTECRELVREIYPHLVGKQHQARILCGCPSSGPDAEAAHQSLMALHNGGSATIDFSAPKTMFEQGWWLRQDVIWAKSNPMPESVTDRCTKSHEYVFLLSKSANYFYDAEAIKEQSTDPESLRPEGRNPRGDDKFAKAFLDEKRNGMARTRDGFSKLEGVCYPTRNKRSVWTIPSQSYSEAHFATFPEALVKPCILAGTSARGCCPKCGAPWERVVEPTPEYAKLIGKSVHEHKFDGVQTGMRQDGKGPLSGDQTRAACPNGTYQTTGWTRTCDCGCTDTVPCTVLDPFGGSFTTCQVALELGRNAVGIELNPEYVKLARARCAVTPGLALA